MSDPPVRLGWWLSSEEHDPRDLVAQAVLAETCGFSTAMISDHLQPWVRHQGHAAYVWAVVGAIANATSSLEVGTGVTSMVHRNHPITIAQAAATAAVMLEDRFFLGVGTGERLNEQAFGERWPRSGERRARLEEAVEVIRQLFDGDVVSSRGTSWAVEDLRLMTLPASPAPIYVAAGGKRSAATAGRIGDGLIGVAPDASVVDAFRGAGGADKPCLGQLHVSLAATIDAAVDNAWEWWPQGVLPASILGELAKPQDFETTAAAVGRDGITTTVVCATDAAPVVSAIDRFVAAGFDTVYLHQVGQDQQRLADLAAGELIAHYSR